MTHPDPPEWWTHRDACPRCHQRHVKGPNSGGWDPGTRTCSAHKTDGTRCGQWPARGGWTCAQTHGGRAPQVAEANARRTAEQAAAGQLDRIGLGLGQGVIEGSASEALIEALGKARWNVAACSQAIAELEMRQDTSGTVALVLWGEKQQTLAEHGLVTLHGVWWDRMLRAAEACHKAGIEERVVRLREATFVALRVELEGALEDIGLDGGQRAAALKALATRIRQRELA